MSTETVFGVPLEPGERVVYFHREEPGWQKPALIVVGVLLLFAIIGIFFLLAGLMATTECMVITNRRFMIITRKKVQQIRREDVSGIRKKIKDRSLRWINVDGPKNTPYLSYQVQLDPQMVPLFDKIAADVALLDRLPVVAYDA